MKFEILGETAKEAIGPSMYLLFSKEGSIVVDCGAQVNAQAPEELILPDFSLLEGKPPVKGIVFTHAHYDHIGGLTELFAYLQNFQETKIFASPQTLAALKGLLRRSLSTKDEDVLKKLKIKFLLKKMRSSILKVGPNELPVLGKVLIVPAGHIPGALSLICGEKRKILITGDICWHDQPSVKGAPSFSRIPPEWRPWAVTTDLTNVNGTEEENNFLKKVEEFRKTVQDAVRSGRRVIIPAFQIGKGQNVIDILSSFADANIPIYIDGGIEFFTRLFNKYNWGQSQFVDVSKAVFVKNSSDRKKAAARIPSLVITTGGMAEGGPVRWWLKTCLPKEENLVVFVSYVAPWSLGQVLLNAKKGDTVKIDDSVLKIQAEVKQIRLSSHASWEEIKREISYIDPEVIVLTHGSAEAKAKATAELNRSICIFGEPGVSLDLDL